MDRSNLCPSCFESTGAADPCPECGYTGKAPSSHIFLKPGTVLFGKYMVGRVLGQGGKIPFDQAVEILMPMMDALREVHEVGFLHRDISPIICWSAKKAG